MVRNGLVFMDGKKKEVFIDPVSPPVLAIDEEAPSLEDVPPVEEVSSVRGSVSKISIYINRIRMFVCLSVGYTLLIKPNSIHMLYMGRSGIYRGRFLSKN